METRVPRHNRGVVAASLVRSLIGNLVHCVCGVGDNLRDWARGFGHGCHPGTRGGGMGGV
eukprot:3952040-Prymnesium_polylepis.2